MKQGIVRTGGIQGIDSVLLRAGHTPLDILSACGLADIDLRCVDEYIAYEKVLKLLQYPADMLGIKDFGLQLAEHQGIDFMGLLALATKGAASIHEAFLLTARYMRFHTPAVELAVLPTSDQEIEKIRIRLLMGDLGQLPQPVEHALLHMANIVKHLSNGAVSPLEVWIPHAPQAPLSSYQQYFDCPIKFGGMEAAITLDKSSSSCPLPAQSPTLLAVAERELLRFALADQYSLEKSLETLLIQLLPTGQFELEDAAATLNLHSRTLQRRLYREGTSFQKVRDNARRQLFQERINEPLISLADLALTLGFSDQSVMTKSCQRWFGESPKKLRQKALSFLDSGVE